MKRRNALLILVVLLAAGCGSRRPPGDVADTIVRHDDPCIEPWVSSAHRRIQRARSLFETMMEVRSELEETGYFDEDPEGSLAWLASASERDRQLVYRLGALRRNIRGSLISLWIATGYGRPIVRRPVDRLLPATPEILHEYETWLEAARGRPLQETIRQQLPFTLAYLETPYFLPALKALERWILFEQSYYPTAEVGQLGPVPAGRKEEHMLVMVMWYARHANRLQWQPSRCMFSDVDGRAFANPY